MTALCNLWKRVFAADLGALALQGTLVGEFIHRCAGDQVTELQVLSKDVGATVVV